MTEAKGAAVVGGFAIIILSLFGLSIVIVDLINIKQHIQLARGNFREVKSSSDDAMNDDKSRKDTNNSGPPNKAGENIEQGLSLIQETPNGHAGGGNNNTSEMRPRVSSIGSVPVRQPEVTRPRLGSAGANVNHT